MFQEKIVGADDSYLSDIIQKLGHEQWINQGITKYLEHTDDCPFCKQKMSDDLKVKIKAHIDTTYKLKIDTIKNYMENYKAEKESSEQILQYYLSDLALSKDTTLVEKIKNLQTVLSNNLNVIEQKKEAPDAALNLELSEPFFKEIEKQISTQNDSIDIFNEKLRNRQSAKTQIKKQFWELLRKKHAAEISSYDVRAKQRLDKIAAANSELENIAKQQASHDAVILESQQNTKNVETAVNRINQRLRAFGLEGFKVQRFVTGDDSQYLYKIIRGSKGSAEFHTLSEGEKTLVSFLYFIEACVGVSDPKNSGDTSNRIIVIDDPISSLSFNSVYDVATLTKDLFLTKNSRYRKIFIMTHHLYFLHEFLGIHKEMQKDWALFRISKSDTETYIGTMTKEEIKNNYEGYWQQLKDAKENKVSKVAIPNAMRNIVEQYFSFIHGQDNLKKALASMSEANAGDLSYKSFERYINRESHSDATNYVDVSEVDTNKYLKFFEKAFTESGHSNHFQIMMGIEMPEEDIASIKPTNFA